MAKFFYTVDFEVELTPADADLLEGELATLAKARQVTISPNTAEFSSALPPEELRPVLLELAWRYGRLKLRAGAKVEP